MGVVLWLPHTIKVRNFACRFAHKVRIPFSILTKFGTLIDCGKQVTVLYDE